MREYRTRIADALLERKLLGMGAVLIEGPKWCGKTTTAEQVAKSVLYMSSPENLMRADFSVSTLLEGKTPRLIDEWQLAPQLWDAIRFYVDHHDGFGHFILTGSSVPPDTSKIFHSGAGRFARLKMRSMALFESRESSGEVSLKSLFEGLKEINGENKLELKDIAFLICRGGWPGTLKVPREVALEQAFDYLAAVVQSDICRVDGVSRNPERVTRLLKSYARHQGTQASSNTIREDMLANDSETLTELTIYSYINALRKIFVIEDVPAWNPNIRSKTAIRTAATRYFTDPSIAVASLGLGPEDIEQDLKTMGLLFETLCVRDIRVYADALGAQVFHYRDKMDLECDIVVHLRNGSYGLIEVKLGGDRLIEQGVESLKRLAEKIDYNKMKAPSFLMVLTAVGRYAYRRKDGVFVVPIGTLKP